MRDFPKEMLDLLMYDLVESKKGKVYCNNIFRSEILLLFPNIEKIIFYTGYGGYVGDKEYPFLFSSFFGLFWTDILFKHKSLKTIQIKGAHHWKTKDRSWIFNEFCLYNKELNQLNQTQFKISLKITKTSSNRKQDSLCIDRL